MRGGIKRVSTSELEKICNEIYVLEAQKMRYIAISEFPEAEMCESIIKHLKQLIEFIIWEESL